MQPKPLKINIGTSFYLAVWLINLHVMAMAISVQLPVNVLFKLMIALVCCASFVYLWRQHVLRCNPHSIVRILQLDQDWHLLQHNGVELFAQLSQATIIASSLVIVYFKIKPQRQRLAILLCSDNTSSNSLRRLRVSLRHGSNTVS